MERVEGACRGRGVPEKPSKVAKRLRKSNQGSTTTPGKNTSGPGKSSASVSETDIIPGKTQNGFFMKIQTKIM